mmetsp:Transcript_34245/g.113319  ORF Transcript_34245/g.113319 Transcript_34245/m.113319 type:complete len:244 (+) Transcript_34245:102-833(+)
MPRARAAGIAKRGVLHSQAHNVLRYAAGVGIHVGLRWQSIRLGAHRLDIRLLRLAGLLKAIRARLAADRVPCKLRSLQPNCIQHAVADPVAALVHRWRVVRAHFLGKLCWVAGQRGHLANRVEEGAVQGRYVVEVGVALWEASDAPAHVLLQPREEAIPAHWRAVGRAQVRERHCAQHLVGEEGPGPVAEPPERAVHPAVPFEVGPWVEAAGAACSRVVGATQAVLAALDPHNVHRRLLCARV